jgi:hypothetical protein
MQGIDNHIHGMVFGDEVNDVVNIKWNVALSIRKFVKIALFEVGKDDLMDDFFQKKQIARWGLKDSTEKFLLFMMASFQLYHNEKELLNSVVAKLELGVQSTL